MDKYRRFKTPCTPFAVVGADVVENVIDALGIERGNWNTATYEAAGTLRSAIVAGEAWFPFSAQGLSVGPSVRPDMLRVDLIDHAAQPHSYLVRSGELLAWVQRVAGAVP